MFEPAEQFDKATKGQPPMALPKSARVLFAVPVIEERVAWLSLASANGHAAVVADTYDAACRMLANDSFHAIVIHPDFDDERGMRLVRHVHRCRYRARMMLTLEEPRFDIAVDALRLGVSEVLTMPIGSDDFRYGLEGVLLKARDDRMQRERINRLRDMCRKLNSARQESTRQVEGLCKDLANAYEGIAGQISEVAMASEFKTLLAQELDLEELLRTTLEYLLTKTGPTNAAVFLPDPDGAYVLGAYVNWDCPREDAEIMLEHLCSVVCPHMAGEAEIVRFEDGAELAAAIGDDAAFLHSSQVIAFACRDGDEPLAIMVLFRDRSEPFEDNLAATLDALRPIFARAVSQVIRVHHRARPQWPVEPAEDGYEFDDDYGFAA